VEKTGGEVTHTLTIDEMPNHSHTGTGYEYLHVAGPNFSSFGALAGGGTIHASYDHSSGGGEAHNNLQPFITCYMWKRTA